VAARRIPSPIAKVVVVSTLSRVRGSDESSGNRSAAAMYTKFPAANGNRYATFSVSDTA
jgi:hypothetical protein